jgi:hypothetical protein
MSLYLTHSNIWPVLAHSQLSSFRSHYFFHIFVPHRVSYFLFILVFPSLLLLHFFPISFICLSYCHSSSLSSLSVIPLTTFFTIQTTKYYRPCKCKGKGKGKVHPRTGHEGPEGKQRYNSTLSLTFVLD